MKVRDYTVESFRSGYCERFYIQGKSIDEAIRIAKNDYNLEVSIEGTGDTYFVF